MDLGSNLHSMNRRENIVDGEWKPILCSKTFLIWVEVEVEEAVEKWMESGNCGVIHGYYDAVTS